MDIKTIRKAFAESYTKSDVCRALGFPLNGTGMRKVDSLAQEHGIDTSHFDPHYKSRLGKYPLFDKTCPVCEDTFEVRKGSPREKTTCSVSCANTYFRSGPNNPNWKENGATDYRKTAFRAYEPKCSNCGYNKYIEVLVVHHKDRDRTNNDIDNLAILCPTCHREDHFLAGDGRWGN